MLKIIENIFYIFKKKDKYFLIFHCLLFHNRAFSLIEKSYSLKKLLIS